jgi:hypothetical protein
MLLISSLSGVTVFVPLVLVFDWQRGAAVCHLASHLLTIRIGWSVATIIIDSGDSTVTSGRPENLGSCVIHVLGDALGYEDCYLGSSLRGSIPGQRDSLTRSS